MLIYDRRAEAVAPRDAFDRTLARLLRAALAGAEARSDPALQEPWWPAFVRDVEAPLVWQSPRRGWVLTAVCKACRLPLLFPSLL